MTVSQCVPLIMRQGSIQLSGSTLWMHIRVSMIIRIGGCGMTAPGLLQSVPALDEGYQPFYEARRRSTVHDVMVEGDRQVEEVARFHALIDHSGFACDAPYDQQQGLPGRRHAPATATTGHA